MKIEADDMTFETLADTGKNWKRFDAVLHAAIVKSVSGELARDIALQGEIAAKEGRLLRGRQSAFMVRKCHVRPMRPTQGQICWTRQQAHPTQHFPSKLGSSFDGDETPT
jgi:hypothetical protein